MARLNTASAVDNRNFLLFLLVDQLRGSQYRLSGRQ